MPRIARWFAVIAIAAAAAVFGAARLLPEQPLPTRPPIRNAQSLIVVPAPPDLEASEPSGETPTLGQISRAQIECREHALATELSKMWTRNPDELVAVIDKASREAPSSPSVTLLLAIAHAETNGKILDVSEAGAVGLAQATPIAIRQENMFDDGRMFVTADYLVGARAYIMKKPLGDTDTIASMVVARDTAATRKLARKLLKSAQTLRTEGVDELALLDLFALEHYAKSIASADEHNLMVLHRLGTLLDHGSRAQLRQFRDKTRREYRALKRTQVVTWARYQHDLIAKRDRMLQEHFGIAAAQVRKQSPYEAGEYLGETLDVRFSAEKMSSFLVRHLERKSEEAKKIAGTRRNVEEMTAALYNGGSHNVKRMLAGLIVSLPETQRYMKNVPATRRRLDRSIVIAGAQLNDARERTLR
jgi:hypothetical protein